jgi:hypothetical protein
MLIFPVKQSFEPGNLQTGFQRTSGNEMEKENERRGEKKFTHVNDHLSGSEDVGVRVQGGLDALRQRDDDGHGAALSPVATNVFENTANLGGRQPCDDDVGVPHGLLEVGDDLERAQGRVDHVDAEPVAEDFVSVESAFPKTAFYVLHVGALANQAPQNFFPGIDHLEKMLRRLPVHFLPSPPP